MTEWRNKTFQEISGPDFSLKESINLNLETPHHPLQGMYLCTWENIVQLGLKAGNLANALSIYHCCLPANGASRMPAEGTTGSDSLLHYPSFILLLTFFFFYCSKGYITPTPTHFIHAAHIAIVCFL